MKSVAVSWAIIASILLVLKGGPVTWTLVMGHGSRIAWCIWGWNILFLPTVLLYTMFIAFTWGYGCVFLCFFWQNMQNAHNLGRWVSKVRFLVTHIHISLYTWWCDYVKCVTYICYLLPESLPNAMSLVHQMVCVNIGGLVSSYLIKSR